MNNVPMTPHRRSHPELYLPGGRCFTPTYPKSAPVVAPAPQAPAPSLEYKFGPVAKVVLCLVAIPLAVVIYTMSPTVFLMMVICAFLVASVPSVEDQAKQQIAVMDEIKKQLDARA